MGKRISVRSKAAHGGTALHLTGEEETGLVVFCVEDRSFDDDENSFFTVHNVDEVEEIVQFLNEWLQSRKSK
jgi:hypothetical protein